MGQPVLALAVAVLAGALPTAVYVTILWWFDRYEKEPVWLFSLAFLWGALPAVLLSLVIELGLWLPLGDPAGGTARLTELSAVAPLVEEGVKGLALLAIFLLYRAEFDGVLDGVIYGAVVGFGFAMSENVLYFGNELVKGGLGSLGVLWVIRALVFGSNHALFTAVTGVGLGLARMSRRRWQRWLLGPLALALAIVLHGVHNLFTALAQVTCWSALVSLFSDWGGLVVLLVVVVLSWQQERRWLITQLRSEVDLGVITAEEYAVLTSSLRRLGSYWQAMAHGGWAAARSRRQRIVWATELAFKKQQLAAVGPTAGEPAAIVGLRARLRGA